MIVLQNFTILHPTPTTSQQLPTAKRIIEPRTNSASRLTSSLRMPGSTQSNSIQQRLSLPKREQGRAKKWKVRVLPAQDFPVSQRSQRHG
jgi:hypothetical protein